jgi:hypothetical protein
MRICSRDILYKKADVKDEALENIENLKDIIAHIGSILQEAKEKNPEILRALNEASGWIGRLREYIIGAKE